MIRIISSAPRQKIWLTHENDVRDPALPFFSLVVSMEHGVQSGDVIGWRGALGLG